MSDAGRALLAQLPSAQTTTLGLLSAQYPGSTWHLADCGCCVCLHPGGDSTRGWLIGADGSTEYHEHEAT